MRLASSHSSTPACTKAVAAARRLAAGQALVAVVLVAVVARLDVGLDHTVAAAGRHAIRQARVVVGLVAVVALLVALDRPVAAGHDVGGAAGVGLAGRRLADGPARALVPGARLRTPLTRGRHRGHRHRREPVVHLPLVAPGAPRKRTNASRRHYQTTEDPIKVSHDLRA
jgi:hypothetical protein